jgi:hypothetical protein
MAIPAGNWVRWGPFLGNPASFAAGLPGRSSSGRSIMHRAIHPSFARLASIAGSDNQCCAEETQESIALAATSDVRRTALYSYWTGAILHPKLRSKRQSASAGSKQSWR